jgi:hypothetical protein
MQECNKKSKKNTATATAIGVPVIWSLVPDFSKLSGQSSRKIVLKFGHLASL